MANLIGKGFVTENKGTIDQTGDWVVDVSLKETRYFDDGSTKEESIVVRVMDSDFQTANEIALRAALTQLREEVYDKGLISLIEAREAEKDATGKADPTALAQ